MKLQIYGSVYTLSDSGTWTGPAGDTLDDLRSYAKERRPQLGPSMGDPVVNLFWESFGRYAPHSEVIEAPEERDGVDVPGLVY